MECYRRAMLGDQTFEGRRENLTQANKLSRNLDDPARGAQSTSRQRSAEGHGRHVHVHAGGQAMVGAIEASRDRSLSSTGGRNAAQITHAPEPALRSSDPTQDALPVPRDEEWPLSHARRKVSGGTER